MKTAPLTRMKEDVAPDPYVVKRPRRGLLLVAAAMVLVGFAIAWAYQRDERRARVLDAATSAADTRTPGSVGTSGTAVPGDGSADQSTAVPPAIIQELDTITGSVDGQELIGRRVDLHVNVQSVANDVAFWVGEKDNRMLVVLARDTRDGAARQQGLPSRHGISPIHAGMQATISGSIQRLPKAEGMYSWQLTEPDYAELRDRKVYIRADTVTTDGHGSHGSGF